MLFNSALFASFFLVFFILYHFPPWSAGAKVWFVIFASLIFYGAWDYRFILLLLFSGLVDFYIARKLGYAGLSLGKKRLLVTLSIAVNLGVLGFFKYTNFLLTNTQSIFSLFSTDLSLPHYELILPIGISFYTFQSMSYTLDVYRGQMQARQKLRDFLASLTFFPQLVAGPIVRASHLVPQFENLPTLRWPDAKQGMLLVALGLCKKNIADLLAPTANAFFANPYDATPLDAWLGALAFTGQIYGDFSGYTDIAIGTALLLGFRIPENFRLPYLAHSPVDFWQRWHISLSAWLRDYLYISLGGKHDRYRNILITMLLGGLWHGANWTFIVWGFYHGVLINLTHWISKFFPAKWQCIKLLRLLSIALTFYLVVIGWVLSAQKR